MFYLTYFSFTYIYITMIYLNAFEEPFLSINQS